MFLRIEVDEDCVAVYVFSSWILLKSCSVRISGFGCVHWAVVARGLAGSSPGHRASERTKSLIWRSKVMTGTFTHARGKSLERTASSTLLGSMRPQRVMQRRACIGKRSTGMSSTMSSSHSGDL